MKIAGVVLAAGAGRRYGMPKALAVHQGTPLIRRAVSALDAVPSVVVVGAAADRVRALAPDLTYVVNPDWESGLGSSLRAGLAAVAGADAAIITLVDMPGVTQAAIARIAACARPGALVMGGYGDRRGHPVLLGREHWDGAAAAAVGDRGARDYLRTHDVRVVDIGDVADDTDLDLPLGTSTADGTDVDGPPGASAGRPAARGPAVRRA